MMGGCIWQMKVAITLILVIAGIAAVACVVAQRGKPSTVDQLQADYPTYSSVEQAVDAADLIVTGVPVAPSKETLRPSATQRSNDPYANPQYGAVEGAGTQQERGVPRHRHLGACGACAQRKDTCW